MKQTINVHIPKQLELLCSLLETTPQQVLQGFIDDVSLEPGSNGSEERRMAVEYFMRVGYGIHRYESGQIETMFDGLNWLRFQHYKKKRKVWANLRYRFLKRWYEEWKGKARSLQ